MEDWHELVWAMLTLVIAAVMLVAGTLYLVTRPEPTMIKPAPAPIVTSSIR